jgi:hypothetical protein
MGHLERESKKRRRKGDMQRLILSTVAVAGGLAVAAVAPNVLGAIVKMGILPKTRDSEMVQRARKNLVMKGFLVYEGKFLRLTPKGEKLLQHLKLKDYKLEKPKRWDKRWRVLIFDIPERRRAVRAQVRTVLGKIGFIRLQDSVWLYPYDCEEVVTLIKADLKIGKDILYLIVDTIEHDASYRQHFGLK